MKKYNGKILIVEDDEHVLLTSHMILKQYFDDIETLETPKTLETRLKQREYDVILLDMNFHAGVTSGNEGIFWMNRIQVLAPMTQVVLQTAYGDIELAVRSIKEGAVDFLPKPWDREKLVTTMLNAYKLSCARKENSELKNRQRELQKHLNSEHQKIIASAPSMRPVMQMVAQVSLTDANVLILGENGTGKELIAKAIHNQSNRANEAFVTVDLGAVPPGLFESEIFGHEKGAYTDAKEARMGKFELANKGTLFLDEIGNLPLSMQVKILSVLQTKTITRLGSHHTVNLDLRVICATNAPMYDLVNEGAIRQDLYYRINTVEIHLPPLRHRKEDIPLLFNHYFEESCKRYHKNLSADPSLTHQLAKYHWPGNIRELQHAVERAVILCTQPELTIKDFQLNVNGNSHLPEGQELNLAHVEKDVIRRAVTKCNGNLTRAAEELGIGRTTLYRKMQEYGIIQ